MSSCASITLQQIHEDLGQPIRVSRTCSSLVQRVGEPDGWHRGRRDKRPRLLDDFSEVKRRTGSSRAAKSSSDSPRSFQAADHALMSSSRGRWDSGTCSSNCCTLPFSTASGVQIWRCPFMPRLARRSWSARLRRGFEHVVLAAVPSRPIWLFQRVVEVAFLAAEL